MPMVSANISNLRTMISMFLRGMEQPKSTRSGKSSDESCIVLRVSLKPQNPASGAKWHKSSQVTPVGKTRYTAGLAVSASGEWLIAVAGHKAYVAQVSALKSGFTKYVSPEALTCLAVHPLEDYFATGDSKGVVRLWYCLNQGRPEVANVEKRSQTSMLHWHAHAVSSLAFTPNGAYLLSAGEEAVLVIWQLHSGKREFVPRVGSPIKSVVVSRGSAAEEEYLLGLADASFVFVNSATLKLSRVFSRIKLGACSSHSYEPSQLHFQLRLCHFKCLGIFILHDPTCSPLFIIDTRSSLFPSFFTTNILSFIIHACCRAGGVAVESSVKARRKDASALTSRACGYLTVWRVDGDN